MANIPSYTDTDTLVFYNSGIGPFGSETQDMDINALLVGHLRRF